MNSNERSKKTVDEIVHELNAMVVDSRANNTAIYEYLDQGATLEEMTHFIRWDAEEPHYYLFLQQWLIQMPEYVRGYLEEHIEIEINEEHSRHFRDMLNHLNTLVKGETVIDRAQTAKLNRTFSPDAVREEDYGYFLGVFFATEIMHAKRAGQLMSGLVRNGIDKSKLMYLIIHFEADEDHGAEIGECMIKPVLERHPEMLESIRWGIEDRLSRSFNYLNWYDQNILRKERLADAGAL